MRIRKSKMPIIIGCIIVALLVLLVILQVIKNNKKADYSNMTDEEIDAEIEEKINNINMSKLADMNERERMEYYVSEFISAIESENYESAYEMLYDDFKENYFPTISSFELYAQEKFPSMISMDYTNIERNGDIYVLWVTLANPLAGKSSGVEMNFVIQENDLNDFALSFSVK